MQRILILGPGGAGKSTLAASLARKLDIPVIHLDQHHWQPGWVNMDENAWNTKVAVLAAGRSWVMDGNYADTLGLRLSIVDLVIVLDTNRFKSIWRAFTRVLGSYGRTRPDMAPDCPERFDREFFVWLWNFPRDTQPEIDAAIEKYVSPQKVVRLKSDAQIAAFLRSV